MLHVMGHLYLQQSTQLGLPNVPPTNVSTKSAMFVKQPGYSLDLV